jgi:hypothetical protein
VTLRQPALRRAELPPPIPRNRAVSIGILIVDYVHALHKISEVAETPRYTFHYFVHGRAVDD